MAYKALKYDRNAVGSRVVQCMVMKLIRIYSMARHSVQHIKVLFQ